MLWAFGNAIKYYAVPAVALELNFSITSWESVVVEACALETWAPFD